MSILQKNMLFYNITQSDIEAILSAAGRGIKRYSDGDIILSQGEIPQAIGIVQKGRAVGVKYTYDGDGFVVSQLKENSIFGDVLAGSDGYPSPVCVIAKGECEVLYISYTALLYSDCTASKQVLANMIKNISMKYFAQNKQLDILHNHHLRERITAYLLWQSEVQGKRKFTIPHNRIRLADYLCCERSALSRELSKMRSEGLIEYTKDEFTILF